MPARSSAGRRSNIGDVAVALTAAAISCLTPATLSARQARDTAASRIDAPRSLIGVVFDSLTLRPLDGAHVHIVDLGREALADSLGRFRFDGVAVGAHAVWADHPALDALGFFSIEQRVDVTSQGEERVVLAIPSFGTLWRRACATKPAPSSNVGIVFGQLRAGGRVPAAATVTLRWKAADSSAEAAAARATATPDADGGYVICGAPVGEPLQLSALVDGASTVPVSFHLGTGRIGRRDISVPSSLTIAALLGDSATAVLVENASGATVLGIVRDSLARPLHDARVTLSGSKGEWRTGSDGGFVVRGVAPGTHVLTVQVVGYSAERRLIDVAIGDSARVELQMSRLVTKLTAVEIRERAHFDEVRNEIDQRRRAGFGYRADSTEFARVVNVEQALNFPGVHITHNGAFWGVMMAGAYSLGSRGGSSIGISCNPSVWIDGRKSDWGEVNDLSKDEIAMIEIYNSGARTPMQFAGSFCGAVLIWRKAYINPP